MKRFFTIALAATAAFMLISCSGNNLDDLVDTETGNTDSSSDTVDPADTTDTTGTADTADTADPADTVDTTDPTTDPATDPTTDPTDPTTDTDSDDTDDSDSEGSSDDDTDSNDDSDSNEPNENFDDTEISDSDMTDNDPNDQDNPEDPDEDSDDPEMSDAGMTDNDLNDQDNPEEPDEDADSGESTEIPECSNSSTTPCKAGGLIWSSRSAAPTDWEHAGSGCMNWSEGKFTSGWRLPKINELRKVMRNCTTTETGGNCRVTDECAIMGTDINGIACYTTPACKKVFGNVCSPSLEHSPFGETGKLWTALKTQDDPDWAWYVSFYNGEIAWAPDWTDNEIYYRCVHNAE